MSDAMTQTKTTPNTPGFTMALQNDTNLGLAVLSAVSDHGQTEIVAVTNTIDEARFLAKEDFEIRVSDVGEGQDRMFPHHYVLHARGEHGRFFMATAIYLTA